MALPPDEDFWVNLVVPAPPAFRVLDPNSFDQSEQATSLYNGVTLEFGYTSKIYPFGTVAGSGSALPTAIPSKMIVTARYSVANNERIIIKVWNGAVSGPNHLYQTVLNHGKDGSGSNVGTYINFLDTEIVLGSNAPASIPAWQTILKASIICAESTATGYAANQPIALYLYLDIKTGLPEIRSTPRPGITQSIGYLPPPTGYGRVTGPQTKFGGNINVSPPIYGRNSPPPGTGTQYVPLGGVQVQFYAKGTNLLFLTAVSDVNGAVVGSIPSGSYDVKFYGGKIPPQMWLTGDKALAIGASDAVNRFGDTADDISQAADFTSVKNTFASMSWVGYMVVEDFTTGRAQFRNELADSTDAFGQAAIFNFGRLYRGLSYIDFIGVAMDPKPS